MPYPHLELMSPSDAAALVITSLPKGEIPLLCTHQGKVRRIASIAKSAKVFDVLSRVSDIKWHASADSAKVLKSTLDIMEVLS